ncbi:bifunctional SulP family inorganic anion transporter/carbonic anhydrase [Streptomyces virginiae]|uniref:bifunctional SulP family inorganic anion transporter/carbonic anhydrase n=1 Tax=Streptomyces virginiae TaxID=1961 RepID=UPI002DBF49EE|nr:bifunctional SulP family inorganic anion transporter/carbonic anhydrase [Streptomyces sp. CMAA1738]MEC4569652.1 bifunctional SulP family inorganic anion transporter/carbonic anhydrase [Streptomyces sp. CMAA1738]
MTATSPTRAPEGVRKDFPADLSASIAVFLIAMPLSLGIALATGAPLQAGLVAAAVGGIVAGRLGGAPLQVSGPAAGLTVVTAELIQRYGWRTTCAITVLAGVCQLGLAALRTARSALMVSPAIVHGMLAGIGVTIALAQLHIVLGGTPQSSAVANVLGLPAQLADLHPVALGVSALTLVVLLGWPRLPGRAGRALRKLPAPLAAVAAATAFAALAGLSLPRVDLPSWRSHALPEMPEGPVLGLIAAVLTITLVGSVESLLSAVATDKLIASERGTGNRPPRADLNRELRGQGAANIVSGALGGLPITGVAVRSVANVKSGAASRKSSMMHGFWVLLAAFLLVPLLDLIPLATLAALVMAVGVQMVSITHLRSVTRHREALVYGTTIVAVVLGGVLEGVAVGIAVAVALALHRLARTRITLERTADGVHRVRARGQLTFLAVPRLSRVLNQIPHDAHAVVELDGSFMDHAAYETIQDWQQSHLAHGGTLEVTGRSGQAARINGADPATADRTGSPDGPDGADGAERAGGGHGAERGHDTRHAEGGHQADRSRRGQHRGTHQCCRPWTPWQNHCDHRATSTRTATSTAAATAAAAAAATGGENGSGDGGSPDVSPAPRRRGAGQLASGISAFQRDTAPHVRDELARLAREGQQPSQLFITCADSRLVTSMITASGPGDLFTVRNVGNLVPLPGAESTDDSVAAAIEYAVDVLKVDSITVCGHSGCGAMQALLSSAPGVAMTPLRRWLRHGLPSLERMGSRHHAWARISGRLPADAVEQLCLTNVVQQLEHLRAHESVARRLAEGTLELHGMYFHVGEAQAYLLSEGEDFFDCRVFDTVGQHA